MRPAFAAGPAGGGPGGTPDGGPPVRPGVLLSPPGPQRPRAGAGPAAHPALPVQRATLCRAVQVAAAVQGRRPRPIRLKPSNPSIPAANSASVPGSGTALYRNTPDEISRVSTDRPPFSVKWSEPNGGASTIPLIPCISRSAPR